MCQKFGPTPSRPLLGYAGGGFGIGGRAGGFGTGEVYNVYKPTDYEGPFMTIGGGWIGNSSISTGDLLPDWITGKNGAASYTAGASTKGLGVTWTGYWIISATDPIAPKPSSSSKSSPTDK